MSRPPLLIRLLALVFLAVAVVLVWAYSSAFLEADLRGYGMPSTTAARTSAFATVFLLFAAPAIPLASLFGPRAWLAALAIGWLPLALALLFATGRSISSSSAAVQTSAVFEGLLCWAAIALGAWLASRFWPPAKTSEESQSTVGP